MSCIVIFRTIVSKMSIIFFTFSRECAIVRKLGILGDRSPTASQLWREESPNSLRQVQGKLGLSLTKAVANGHRE